MEGTISSSAPVPRLSVNELLMMKSGGLLERKDLETPRIHSSSAWRTPRIIRSSSRGRETGRLRPFEPNKTQTVSFTTFNFKVQPGAVPRPQPFFSAQSTKTSNFSLYPVRPSPPGARAFAGSASKRKAARSRGLGSTTSETKKEILTIEASQSKQEGLDATPDVSQSTGFIIVSGDKFKCDKEDGGVSHKGSQALAATVRNEEAKGEYADELDDEVPLLESDISEQTLIERRRAIHCRSTLCLDHDFGNFSAEIDKKATAIIKKFRGAIITDKLKHRTSRFRNEYDEILLDLDTITYYVHRQRERSLHNYMPRSVVLISSAVPKAEELLSAVKPNVLGLIYDNTAETYESLLIKFKELLDSYKTGAKARHLAIVCKGGPGYFYILKSKPVTSPNLLLDDSLLKFWKGVGSNMSKIYINRSIVHLMECNVARNAQGVELLSNLELAMFGHKVKVESPLELEPKGKEMISSYFVPGKFVAWKSRQYSIFKPYH